MCDMHHYHSTLIHAGSTSLHCTPLTNAPTPGTQDYHQSLCPKTVFFSMAPCCSQLVNWSLQIDLKVGVFKTCFRNCYCTPKIQIENTFKFHQIKTNTWLKCKVWCWLERRIKIQWPRYTTNHVPFRVKNISNNNMANA